MKKYVEMSKQRIKKGYTLENLGHKLGLTKQYLWDIEEGRRTLTYKLAYRISVLLDTTPDKLFLEDNKRK